MSTCRSLAHVHKNYCPHFVRLKICQALQRGGGVQSDRGEFRDGFLVAAVSASENLLDGVLYQIVKLIQ